MAMDGSLQARGELGSGEDSEGRGLGEVEDGMEVLIIKAIESRRPGGGDGQWCSWLCSWRGACS